MSDDTGRLDQTIRRAFSALPASRDGCPPPQDLIRFHAGELNLQDAARIESHVLRCAGCDRTLDRLDHAATALNDASSARTAVEAAALPTQSCVQRWARHWKPALAGALAASILLALPLARLARSPAPHPASLSTGAELARVLKIPQDRAALPVPVLRLYTADERIVVSFFVPMKPGLKYTAAIEDQHGTRLTEPLDISAQAASGDVGILLQSGLLSPGQYRVGIQVSQGNAGSRPLDMIPFEVVR